MARVVVVGSVNVDVVVRAPRHPTVGETVLGSSWSLVPGGKGANQAVAASRLATPTELVGRVGTDAFGDRVLEFLGGENLGLSGVRRLAEAPTGAALVVVDDSGDNTIVAVPGANHALTVGDVEALPIEAGDVVVCQYELRLEVVHAALAHARDRGARTILNPAPALPSPPGLLGLADVLAVNQSELAFFVANDGLDPAPPMRALRQRADQVVVTTLGAGGAAALIGNDVVRVPGRSVAVVDTTGAGDCFVGVLAAALCSWAELDEAVHLANLAASIAVQRSGAGVSMPYLADVEALR